MSRTVPANLEAEATLLGTMLSNRQECERALDVCGPEHFYKPEHARVFTAIRSTYHAGRPIEPTTVAGIDPGLDRGLLARLRSEVSVTGSAAAYIDLVDDCYRARLVIALGGGLTDAGYDQDLDQAETLLNDAEERLMPPADDEIAVVEFEELMERPSAEKRPWVVPGLLRLRDSLILTGGEGHGKMTMLRQWVIAAASGVHPFTEDPAPYHKGLVIDLQEDEDDLRDVLTQMHRAAKRTYRKGHAVFAPRPQGMNLLARRDVRWLETQIKQHEPSLVVIGPLRKMFRAPKGASVWDESVVLEVQAVLSDLQVAYDFTLCLEGHAGHDRDTWRVMGSSAWYGWPDFGFGLASSPPQGERGEKRPTNGTAVREVWPVRWRGDRYPGRPWPGHLVSGPRWPWEPLQEARGRIRSYLERENETEQDPLIAEDAF